MTETPSPAPASTASALAVPAHPQPAPSVSVAAFLPFYLDLAPRDALASALAPLLEETVAPEARDDTLHTLWDVLVCTVEGHSYRTLIGEFHAHREALGLPVDADSRTALDSFTALLADPERRAALLGRYPVLAERLKTVIGNIHAACREMLQAWRDDAHVLAEAFGLDPAGEALTRVAPSPSDPHNGNRRVFFVTTASGHDLVYKPRPLTGDDLLRDLYRAAGERLTHSLEHCVPESVTVGHHGWQRFTEASPMTASAEPARYFYRFGALTCLLSAIGATDLHDENLLAHGEHPCVIDSETVLRGDGGVPDEKLPHRLINHMKSSVTSTMLLPVENPDSAIDVLMSGAGLVGEQESQMRTPSVADKESDAIRVVWDTVTYHHTTNVPRLGDDPLLITDHFPHVMAGYRDALAFLAGPETEEVLRGHPDTHVRSVLRSTEVYSRYLDASTHPRYLGSRTEADRLLGLLNSKPRPLPEGQLAYLRDAESQGLDAGDIPYFSVRAGATTLRAHDRDLPDFFTVSPVDNALRGVRAARERHERYHQFLVEECIGGIASAPGGLSAHSVFGGDALARSAPGTWGFAVADVVRDLAVTAQGADGLHVGWLGSIGPDRNAATITPGNYVAFHDMGGITRLMRRAAALNGRYTEFARAADAGLATLTTEYRNVLDTMPESVFSGLASLLLSRPDAVDDAWTGELVALMERRGEDREPDVANGPAGVLMALLARLENGRTAGTGAIEDVLRLAFADARRAPGGAEMELAHGDLGLYWAKARAGRVLGHRAMAEEAFGWLAARLDGHRPAVPGWCKGAAGVLLAAAEICHSAGRYDWLAGQRLDALVTTATALDDGPVEVSVCHGSSGTVQALLSVAALTGDTSLADRARAHQAAVLDRARRYGFYTGVAGRTSLIGYMLGWSGVADTDLMLASATPAPAPIALTGEER
ncbi:type 2 lanthipeptide synthetase LanM [Streptomyces sp. NRRL F-5630]|uniref:type 2 lanthipeptide synthetase LanM n=1 Tax=Streptomyces sp. NRRL F-5630 TaxID=1463864 RepID=UPI003D7223C3